MTHYDPYLSLEGSTRLYYRGIENFTALDSVTTLPLYLEWTFAHPEFSVPLNRPRPRLQPVTGHAGLDRAWHVLPLSQREAIAPLSFNLHAYLADGYAMELVRFVGFESPVNGIGFDPVLRDWANSATLTVDGESITLPEFPEGYRLLNIERIYRKKIGDTQHNFGRRYQGCLIDPGAMVMRENPARGDCVEIGIEVQCWGDVQTITTFMPGLNVFQSQE